jgi:hypothetical protein
MQILGTIQIIVFYIKTGLSIPKNVNNQGWDKFFLFAFVKFFHFGDENVAREHEIN